MGTAVKIDDMARDLITLSGFEPEVDIPIEYIGLRAGEKLHEVLSDGDETPQATSHPKILMTKNKGCNLNHLEKQIDELVAVCAQKDSAGIRRQLQAIIAEYNPVNNP
jgi:FlaA1/EpsC-like NDP-sugar epimerase